ncbi:MAG: nicotinamide mononucleotide transporter [Bacteroidales bacterium]|nr:nicotinamide mononucleotide transporter [Bacteroidales bacterium]
MFEFLEIIGTIVGLVYLYLEYKASIHLWIAGIIMPAIYIFIYWDAGLYADFGINVYYLLAALYGWFLWKYGNKNKCSEASNGNELPISKIPKRLIFPSILVFVLTFILILYILISFTDSNVPYLDSYTTALSIVGMWMLARKFIEQWWVWIVVDLVSAGLYVYKELYLTSGLYALYAVIAFFGYLNWKKLMK